MKTIEQKAKAYDEALEKAKKLYEKGTITESISYIFPEIEKSEDERVRKALLNEFIHLQSKGYKFAGLEGEEIIAWLVKQGSVEEIVERCKKSWYNEGKIDGKFEGIADDVKYQQGWHDAIEKQGKQETLCDKCKKEHPSHFCQDITALGRCYIEGMNTSNKVKPKFHEGDWIIFNEHHNSVYIVEKIQGLQYYLRHYNGGLMSVYIGSPLIRQWTVADAKDGDVLYSLDSKQPFIFKHRKPNEQAKVYCGINIYGKFFVGNTKDCIITTDKYIPATKEQRDLLFQKMKEAGYMWDAEKKELKKVENEIEVPFSVKDSELKEEIYYIPKGFYAEIDDDKVVIKKGKKPTAWSEEDEKNLKTAIWYVENPALRVKDTMLSEWLKSIKERVQPQPKQ